MDGLTIGSSLSLPDDPGIYGFKLWVVVPANQPTGVLVDALQTDDQVIVNQTKNLNGLAAFTKSKMPDIAGIVGMANYVRNRGNSLLYPDQTAATPFVNAWSQAFDAIKQAAHQNKIEHKRRNAFGKDPGGDKKYALDEGGVILCMPEAAGPIYSNKDTRPASGSKDNGRLPKYWPERVKQLNSGFLYKSTPGFIVGGATRPGGLVVVAFDEGNAFGDNNGAYAMEVIIIRSSNSPAGMTQSEIFDRMSDAPPLSGIGDLGLNG
jgi:hypothetical protein